MKNFEILEEKVRETNLRWFLKSRMWKEMTNDLWLDPVDNSLKSIIEAVKVEKERLRTE